MRILLLVGLIAFYCFAFAEDKIPLDIEAAKYQKLSVCMYVGDIASAVQEIRHDGDTEAMFESRAPKLLKADGQPEWKINKAMAIGRDVYHNIPVKTSRTDTFVIYYTDCINNYENMVTENDLRM